MRTLKELGAWCEKHRANITITVTASKKTFIASGWLLESPECRVSLPRGEGRTMEEAVSALVHNVEQALKGKTSA